MKKVSLKSSLLLLLTAFIWGVAFVSQSVGMDYLGPLSFNGARFLMGGGVLLPVIAYNRAKKKSMGHRPENLKTTVTGGISCGFVLGIAALLQQYGILYTTVGKAGFITTLYIILVPFFGIFLKKKVPGKVWTGAVIAALGLYLLCMGESLSLGRGDTLVFLCAILFSVHILVIDYFAQRADGVKMSCIQFFVCGILCVLPMLFFEKPQIRDILTAWQPILYAGVLSCGAGYTLQIVGQKGMNPTIASLILSLESVVSVLAGMMILQQQLSRREILGCVLMFSAIILAQLPQKE